MNEIREQAQLCATTTDGQIRVVQTDDTLDDVLDHALHHGKKQPHMNAYALVQETYTYIMSVKELKENCPEYWQTVYE